MDIAKYRDMYLSEAAEHLQKMCGLLVALENSPKDKEGISALFREAHSLKGMAATMGYEFSARLAHHLEDSLDICRDLGEINVAQIDHLLTGVDLLEGLLEDIRQNRPEREVDSFINALGAEGIPELLPEELIQEQTHPQVSSEGGILIRLKLDETVSAVGPRLLVLLKHLGETGALLESVPGEEAIMQGAVSRELLVRLETVLTQKQILAQLQNFSELAEVEFPVEKPQPVVTRQRSSSGTTVRVNTDLLDHFINLTGELITNRYALQAAAGARNWRDMNDGLGQLNRLVKNLHHQVLQLRMLPLETVTGRLSRTVRDLGRASGKDIQFSVEGANIELDRAILDELGDPLVHMIRNAIDHGVEREGRVSLKAWRERDQVLIQVADNGRGINPEKIRQRAQQCGLLSTGQVRSMRDYDLLQLICLPGFSTKEEVSETSGRGVGMDVVKTAVERLGGVLMIDSALGEGTHITMKLPLSVAIIRVLMIECDGILIAMPITRVIQTVEVVPQEIQTSGKQLVISYGGELLPLLSLRKILQRPKRTPNNSVQLVVTEVMGRKVGLVVDRLVGQREVFVQPLPAPFDGIRGCSGGTILGDGRIMFVLDLQSLLETRRS